MGGLAGLLTNSVSFNPIPSFRANGGSVSADIAYTVGEIGQEMFISDRSGRIVPMAPAAGGGAVGGLRDLMVSIDARGTQGNSEIQAAIADGVQTGIAEGRSGVERDNNGIVRQGRARYG